MATPKRVGPRCLARPRPHARGRQDAEVSLRAAEAHGGRAPQVHAALAGPEVSHLEQRAETLFAGGLWWAWATPVAPRSAADAQALSNPRTNCAGSMAQASTPLAFAAGDPGVPALLARGRPANACARRGDDALTPPATAARAAAAAMRPSRCELRSVGAASRRCD